MIVIACALTALALVDGGLSGFRSALGRTGLVRHRPVDLRAAVRGLPLVVCLLIPSAFLTWWRLATAHDSVETFAAAGGAMLWILLPYAAAVSTALVAYGVLGWRQKYLAMAVVLGPFTLIRPVVALAAGAAGIAAAHDRFAAVAVLLGVVAVLAIEPAMNRTWRTRNEPLR